MPDVAPSPESRIRLRARLAEHGRRALQRAPGLVDQAMRYARLMRLHRPIGIWLLLWPTLWALWIAARGRPDEHVFVVLVLGTIIARSAGCIVNDLADRKIDPHVRRTADRPLASGEMVVPEASILFAGLMLIALGLVLTLNRLTIYLAICAAAITIVYPFTKRFLATPQLVLGVAFAWGVPMAFAAELGSVPRLGWLLLVSAIIFGVIYDTEYAMVDRDDDIRIGVHSTAILFGEMDRVLIGVLQLSLFAGLGLVGDSADLGAWYYGALIVAAGFALYQQFLIKDREPAACFRAFTNNAWLGGAVFAGIALDYLFRA
jgi:4-hydroxybenzoate polyprenyltransferase